MDRACLDPGALGEVARSLAGRGGDHIRHKSVIALSEAMHDGFNERGLAAARAAEDDGEAAVQRQLDRLALLFAEENVPARSSLGISMTGKAGALRMSASLSAAVTSYAEIQMLVL